MKKISFYIVLASIVLLPVSTYAAMSLSDVLNLYYVGKAEPKVLGASTSDGGATTTSIKENSVSPEVSKSIIKGLRYAEGSSVVVKENLKKGMKSDEVKKLQLVLIAKGYLDAQPTGYYGPLTIKAVKELQKKHGIVHSGRLVGPATRAAIEAEVIATTPDMVQ